MSATKVHTFIFLYLNKLMQRLRTKCKLSIKYGYPYIPRYNLYFRHAHNTDNVEIIQNVSRLTFN